MLQRHDDSDPARWAPTAVRRRQRLRTAAAIALLVAGARWSGAGAAAVDPAADPAFASDSLQALVYRLADDRLEGRGPGTAGIDVAADFIATRFAAAGLRPAGEGGTFFQPFDVTIGVRPSGRNALRCNGQDLEFSRDWNAYGFSDTGTTRAAVAFAGYGIQAPEYDYDDYAQLDVKGKVVLVLRYEPGRDDSASVFEGRLHTAHADLRRKAILARERGATGMLVVTGPRHDEPDELAKLRPDVGYQSTGIPCGQLTRAALARALPQFDLAAVQQRIDSTSKPATADLGTTTLEWTIGLAKERTRLKNVVGLLPGKDAGRAIVIGAHYDHLGMGGENSLAPDDRAPHNGADDNASGTAALVALARHFAVAPPPPVSIVFAAFSGEELGLVGSSHYVKQPVVGFDSTLVMLNMDMVGRLRDRKLFVFGTATAQEFPHLLEILNSQGPRFDLKMKGDGYGPSDHMSFFKKGIPVLHFFTGAHPDYHKPSDDADRLDYRGLSEVTAFVAAVASATMENHLTFVAATGPAPSSGDSGGGGGFRSYLGTIPDYGQDENLKGVLLSGVRKDSPAEKAGLQSGDVIVQIESTVIANIQDFVFVLRTRKPGDTVAITVQRAGEAKTVQATLAPRP